MLLIVLIVLSSLKNFGATFRQWVDKDDCILRRIKLECLKIFQTGNLNEILLRV